MATPIDLIDGAPDGWREPTHDERAVFTVPDPRDLQRRTILDPRARFFLTKDPRWDHPFGSPALAGRDCLWWVLERDDVTVDWRLLSDDKLAAHVRARLSEAGHREVDKEAGALIAMYVNRSGRISHFARRSHIEGCWVSKVGTYGNVLLHDLHAFTADYGVPAVFFA